MGLSSTLRFLGSITLKTAHGKYLSAQPNGTLEANRDKAQGWEYFTVERNPVDRKAVSFKTAHGKYICAEPSGAVVANRDAAKGWEAFTPV